MPYDYSKLFENPAFQFGASIMGNTGQPGVVGSAFGQMAKVNSLKAEAAAQARNSDIAQGHLDLDREEAQATKAYRESQGGLLKQQQDRLAQQLALQRAVVTSIFKKRGMPIPPELLGPGEAQDPAAPTPVPQPQAQPQLPGGANIAPIPNMPQGPNQATQVGRNKLGSQISAQMAPQIWNQESGNNNGVRDSINGAVGPGQMMPATFQRFARPGENIRNPQDNRNVSQRYLDYLSAKAGGDPAKIAAGYFSGEGNIGAGAQPFKRNVADGNGMHVADYVRQMMGRMGYADRVQAGLDQPPAQGAGIQGPPTDTGYMEDAQDAVMMGSAGMSGAAQQMEMAKMEAPQQVPAGGYTRQNGVLTYNGDPQNDIRNAQKDRELAQTDTRIAQQAEETNARVAKESAERTASELKVKKERAADNASFSSVMSKMDAVGTLADKIVKAPGLKYNTGKLGALGLGKMFDEGRNTGALIEQMKSKLKVEVMMELKNLSANGSTGMGQLSTQEGETLGMYISNLDKAQTEEQFKEAVADIQKWKGDVKGRMMQSYKDTYGELPKMSGAPAAPDAATPAATPKIGTVDSGYMYMGGNPKDKASWKPVSKGGK